MEKQHPKHVAIIMDGNGRWAKKNNLPVSEGHKIGALVAKEAIKNALELKIPYLSLFAFSHENWLRDDLEVKNILELLKWYLENEIPNLDKKITIQFIGDSSYLKSDIAFKMQNLHKNESCDLTVYIAFSYGGRQDIINACNKAITSGMHVDFDNFSKLLSAPDMPDVDLLIRTGGEKRISNFLMWHIAYAEIFFMDVMWPDFDLKNFLDALDFFHTRKRNFGLSRY